MTEASPQRANMGFIFLIVAVATIGGFLFGFDSGVINGTVTGLQQAFNATDIGTGFNVGSMLLGCAAGAFIAGRLSDMIGRRNVLLIAARKVAEIRESVAKDHQPRLSDLYDRNAGRIRPILWVGIGLAVFQQLVGINIVFYYGAVLWQAVGVTKADALFRNVLSGALSILACLAAIALIDRIGRRPLLLIGSAGMAVTLGLMAYAFSTGTFDGESLDLSDDMGVLALYAANGYVIFFNFSWGPVMWVMLGEMFPNQIRGSGLAVSGFAQWFANFGITMTFPIMLGTIGLTGAYGFYAASAFVSFFFVRAMVHETRGRELEDMVG